MGGIGLDIPLTAIDGKAQDGIALYRAIHTTILDGIAELGGKVTWPVLSNLVPEYGESANATAPLMFGFYDGGGGCMLSMDIGAHWFSVLTQVLRRPKSAKTPAPLVALAAHHGYAMTPIDDSVEAIVAAEKATFLPLRRRLYQARPGEISADTDAGVVGYADLTDEERALVDEVVRSERCRCPVCINLLEGKRPKAPWVPAPPAAAPPPASLARKQQLQLEQLGELPPAVLGAKQLRSLSISNGALTSLPDALGDLPKLESLTLHRTKIGALPRLPALTSITVMFSPVASMATLLPLGSLRYLRVEGVLPSAIASLTGMAFPALRTLQLDRSEIDVLPALDGVPAITSLSAAHNRLTALPALPTGITALNLEENLLRALPPFPAGLEILTLDDNPLEEVTLRGLDRLTVLNLRRTKLTVLPELPAALEILDLSGSPITALPAALRGLERLHDLRLDGTALGPWERWVDVLPSGLRKLSVDGPAPGLAKALPHVKVRT
jgi:hypothetical protein